MAEQNQKSTARVHVVNRKGVSNFFSQEQWDRMAKKEDAQGWRGDWRAIRPGESPADVVASANIPAEFRKVNKPGTGPQQSPAAAKAGLQLTDDEKRVMIQKEIDQAIEDRKQEIEQSALEQAQKVESELLPEITRLIEFVTQQFPDSPDADSGSIIDKVMGLLGYQKDALVQLGGRAANYDQLKEEAIAFGATIEDEPGAFKVIWPVKASDSVGPETTTPPAAGEPVTDPTELANKGKEGAGGKGGGGNKKDKNS